MLELKDKWIWDFWLFQEDEDWHIFFLQADKALGDPDLRHWNVTQGHAVSKDLVNWQHKGTVLAPAAGPAWDDKTTWTGSVVNGDDGKYHYFYTGTSEAEKGMYQRIGHAVGDTLDEFERVGSGLCLDVSGDERYEDYDPQQWHDRAMRDPWVMRDPEGEGWLMFFTARSPNIAEPNAGGAIGLARSKDLYEWHLEAPVFIGGFGQLEVPQVFEEGGKWYCVFCTANIHWSKARIAETNSAPVTGNHYLIADNPRGPWDIAPEFLDGAQPPNRYAGKIVKHNDKFYIMGFLHDDENGIFIGKVGDPVEIERDEAGLWRFVKSQT